jgi:hypothetical protein
MGLWNLLEVQKGCRKLTVSYWNQFYEIEPLSRCRRRDADPIFDWLNETLPFCGSKVDWARLGAVRHESWSSGANPFPANLLAAFCESIPPESRIIHVGDNLSEFGIEFSFAEAIPMLGCLLEIPEHHYLVPEDRSWIGVITFEGDADLALGLFRNLGR